MPSDVHIGEKVPLHDNGVPPFTIHVIHAMFRRRIIKIFLPPILPPQPLVDIDNLGYMYVISLLKLDFEELVNNIRPNPFHIFTSRLFCYYEEVLNCSALRSPSQTASSSSSETTKRTRAFRCSYSRSLSQRLSKDALDIRKPLIISTFISLKHYIRIPLLAR